MCPFLIPLLSLIIPYAVQWQQHTCNPNLSFRQGLPQLPMASSASIALTTISRPLSTRSSTPTSSATTASTPASSQQNRCTTQQISSGVQLRPTSYPANNTQSSTTTQPSAQTKASRRGRVVRFLLTTWLGNLAAVTGVILATCALAWGLYSVFAGLRLQFWTVRNDVLQSCLSLQGGGRYSKYCNETVEAVVEPPPPCWT